MSFRSRLVLAVSLVTAMTLGGAFAVVSGLFNREQQQQLDRALLEEAAEEAKEVAALGGRELAISDRPGPAANAVGPLTKYAAIYNMVGHVQAMTPTFHGAPPLLSELPKIQSRCFDLWFHREHLRGTLVQVPDRADLTLLLAAPRTDLDSDAAFLFRAMVAVWAVAVLWAALVASWAVRRLTRNHQTLAAVVRRVAAGDRSARVSILSSDAEIAQLERDINEMIERIDALVRSQQRFIAHAAHELRSPLTSLLGELSHAVHRPRDAEGYRAAIDEALVATRHLKVLTEDLLTLVRLDAGPQNSAPREPLLLSALLKAATREIEVELDRLGLEVVMPAADLLIHGSPLDLVRMLRNLLENAARHSPAGGRIEVACRLDGGFAELTLRDEGSGVAPNDRERIFEPFYRGSRERADGRPGAGLGLAIAREIARAHGGDIALAIPSPSVGAAFVVRVPVGPPVERDRSILAASAMRNAETQPSRDLHSNILEQ